MTEETRANKIIRFLLKDSNHRNWCTADRCGCRGCLNGSSRKDWKNENPDQEAITKSEFDGGISWIKENIPGIPADISILKMEFKSL